MQVFASYDFTALDCQTGRSDFEGFRPVVSEPPGTEDCYIALLQACPHEQYLVLICRSFGKFAELLK